MSFFGVPAFSPPKRRDTSSIRSCASWMFARPKGVAVIGGRYQSERDSTQTHVSGGYEMLSFPPNIRGPA